MKKYLIALAALLLTTTVVQAAPVSWDFTSNILRPLQSMWGSEVRVPWLTATSTTATSTLPNLTSTNLAVTGRFLAGASTGSSGQVLQTTGSGIQWVATSSLGISGGGSGTSSNEWDLFIIAGQSNAVASAGTVASATYAYPGTAKSYYEGTIIDVSNDLNPGNGGPWPAFANRYYQLTGRKVAFVQTAVGGTGITATSSSNDPTRSWGPEGLLHASSVQSAIDATAAYSAQGLVPIFKGVLWSQGENDAVHITSGGQTSTQYREALESVIQRYRDAFGTTTPFYIFRTGSHVTASNIGYSAVRLQQENVAASDPNTYVVFRDAIDYVNRGMMFDLVHYNQFGYNDMGRIGAEGVVMSRNEPRFWQISNALIYNTSVTSTPRLLIGDVGVATSTWASSTHALEVYGSLRLTGGLADSTGATGSNGQVLQSTGTSTRWANASSTGGASNFLDLDDTPSSFTANRIPFTNSSANALTDSANLVFTGTDLGIGTAAPWGSIQINGNTALRPSIFEDGNLGFATNFNTFIMVDADNNSSNNYVSFGRNASTTGEILGTYSEFGRFWDTGRFSIGSSTAFNAMLQVQATSTAPLMSLNSNTNVNYVTVTSNGNFGIGTSSPSALLTVSGDMRLTGRFADSSSSTGSGNQLLTSTTTGTAWVTPSALCVAITGSASLCDGSDDGGGGGGGLATSTPWTVGNLALVASNGAVNSIATSALAINLSDTVGTLGETRGGTNQTSYATGDVLYASSANTLAKLAIGTPGQVLMVSGGIPTWTATSSLGITGVSTFLDLTDTPSSFTANRIPFTNTGATALTDSAGLTFDGSNLIVGTPPAAIEGAITVNRSSALGPTLFNQGNLLLAGEGNVYLVMDHDNNNANRFTSFAHHGTTTSGASSVIEVGRLYDTGRLSLATTTFGAMLEVVGTSTANLMNLTTTGGVNAMRVTSAGNVGIGTTSPVSTLSVSGNSTLAGNLRLTGTFSDSSNSAGSSNNILTSTGAGTSWVTPSSLCVAITGSAALCDGSDDGGGGGGGALSTTTDLVGNGPTSTVSYVTGDVMFGGSSSTTAEFQLDADGSKFIIASTTANSTSTWANTNTAAAVQFGVASNTDYAAPLVRGLHWSFASTTQAIVTGFGTVTAVVWQGLTHVFNTILVTSAEFLSELRIPTGTAPTVDRAGEIVFDSTDNQLLVGTSTDSNAPGVLPITQSLGSFIISSTTAPFTSGFTSGVAIPFKIHRDGYTVTEIHCDIDGGTSIVVNFDNGTGNTSTVTCDTDGASVTGLISNNVVAAGAVTATVETGTVTGSPNYLRVSVFGTFTRE